MCNVFWCVAVHVRFGVVACEGERAKQHEVTKTSRGRALKKLESQPANVGLQWYQREEPARFELPQTAEWAGPSTCCVFEQTSDKE